MAGKGGRPKGGSAKHDTDDKSLPIVNSQTNSFADEFTDIDGIRDAIQEMLSGNLPNLKGWLTQIGTDNPEKALSIFKDFAEYVLPKQQRTDGNKDTQQPIIINFEPSSKANIKMEAPITIEAPQPKPQISKTKQTSLDELFRTIK